MVNKEQTTRGIFILFFHYFYNRPNGCLIKFGVGFMLATLIFMCFMGFVLYKILSNKFNDDISKLTDDISILTDDNSKLNDDISKLRDDLNQSLESHKSLQEKFQNSNFASFMI